MKHSISSFVRDRRGANLVEYIIVLGFVALIAIAAFSKFGKGLTDKVDEQTQSLQKINGAAATQ
jgi:pilus assembly protein Flp/PilA